MALGFLVLKERLGDEQYIISREWQMPDWFLSIQDRALGLPLGSNWHRACLLGTMD